MITRWTLWVRLQKIALIALFFPAAAIEGLREAVISFPPTDAETEYETITESIDAIP